MHELTSPEVQAATKSRDDFDKQLDDITANYWSGHGNERVYINGLFTGSTDVYVDINEETVTVSGTKTRWSDVEQTEDGIKVVIKRPSSRYEVDVAAAESDGSCEETTESDDDSDVDLERFGVDI